MKKYKCGIIGLGRIGCGFDDNKKKNTISTHAGAYSNCKYTQLVALCDIDKAKLSKYGKKYNVKGLYTDYNKMFQNEKLDFLSICTLADSHLDIVKSATKYAIKGIFLEKPISNNLKNAQKIIELCKKNKIKLQVDHQRRFEPMYHKIRDLINSENFGSIQRIHLNYVAGIANTGSHFFDLLRYLLGEIEWVLAKFSINPSHNPADPNVDGTIKFQNGIHCDITAFDLKFFRILELDIIGTKARIRVDLTDSSINYFIVGNKKAGVTYRGLILKPFVVKKSRSPIVLGMENLIESVEKDIQPLCSGDDGYSSLEAIIAVINSAKNNGKLIHLPLKNSSENISSR